jgi:SAM-dependent methyltransferase
MSVGFDEYAKGYDTALAQGLSATGESKDYFARHRIMWLSRCLRELFVRPQRIMDYGCGTGSATNFFFELLQPDFVMGVDTSDRSLELARQSFAGMGAEFLLNSDYKPDGEVDLAYCNGVFHHIPPSERDRELDYVRSSLRPGGLFSFWENNPWNPGTRYVMSRIPFDRDAVTIAPTEARTLLRKNGFRILRTDFLFFFPNFLKSLRWMEPLLSGVPLGGQYQVLCQRPNERSGNSVEQVERT